MADELRRAQGDPDGAGTRWGVLTYRWVAGKLVLQLAIILTGALVIRPSEQALIDRAADEQPSGRRVGSCRSPVLRT